MRSKEDYLYLLGLTILVYFVLGGIVIYFNLSIQLTIVLSAMILFLSLIFWGSLILDGQMEWTRKHINGAAEFIKFQK